MSNHKITIDFSKKVINIKGEPVKDMIDPPINQTELTAPDLTLGSLISNALTIGISKVSPKEALNYLRIAQSMENALKENEGKLDFDEAQISKLEDAIQKVTHPLFTVALYMGSIQQLIENAKLELLAKQKGS